MSSRFPINSEANALELIENVEEAGADHGQTIVWNESKVLRLQRVALTSQHSPMSPMGSSQHSSFHKNILLSS